MQKSEDIVNPAQTIIWSTDRTKAFKRYAADDSKACDFQVFGLTRKHVHKLISDNITNSLIQELILPAVQEAMVTEAFIQYLRNAGIADLVETLNNYSSAHEKWAVNDYLSSVANNIEVMQAYIDYDLKHTCVDHGWSHPRILQALAHLWQINLHIWQLDRGRVIPHSNKQLAVYELNTAKSRIDLLLSENNRFDWLVEFSETEIKSFTPPKNLNVLLVGLDCDGMGDSVCFPVPYTSEDIPHVINEDSVVVRFLVEKASDERIDEIWPVSFSARVDNATDELNFSINNNCRWNRALETLSEWLNANRVNIFKFVPVNMADIAFGVAEGTTRNNPLYKLWFFETHKLLLAAMLMHVVTQKVKESHPDQHCSITLMVVDDQSALNPHHTNDITGAVINYFARNPGLVPVEIEALQAYYFSRDNRCKSLIQHGGTVKGTGRAITKEQFTQFINHSFPHGRIHVLDDVAQSEQLLSVLKAVIAGTFELPAAPPLKVLLEASQQAEASQHDEVLEGEQAIRQLINNCVKRSLSGEEESDDIEDDFLDGLHNIVRRAQNSRNIDNSANREFIVISRESYEVLTDGIRRGQDIKQYTEDLFEIVKSFLENMDVPTDEFKPDEQKIAASTAASKLPFSTLQLPPPALKEQDDLKSEETESAPPQLKIIQDVKASEEESTETQDEDVSLDFELLKELYKIALETTDNEGALGENIIQIFESFLEDSGIAKTRFSEDGYAAFCRNIIKICKDFQLSKPNPSSDSSSAFFNHAESELNLQIRLVATTKLFLEERQKSVVSKSLYSPFK